MNLKIERQLDHDVVFFFPIVIPLSRFDSSKLELWRAYSGTREHVTPDRHMTDDNQRATSTLINNILYIIL
jgi:hypothetical protein